MTSYNINLPSTPKTARTSRMREDLDICVCNPITDKYTTYEIQIQTVNPAFNLNCSHTRRRYNDFSWLRKILKNHHPMSVCPELPAKKTFSERFEPQCIVERMKSLEDWIFSLLEIDLFFSDTTVHLFLQTNLTCSQMEGYVNGRLSSGIVRKAYKACKLKYEQSLMRTLSREPPDRSNQAAIKSEPIDLSYSTRLKAHCSENTQRSYSGLPSSAISSDDDSSYESQNGNSSSSSDTACSVNFPKVMDNQTSRQSKEADQSLISDNSLCDSFKSTSLTSGDFIEERSLSEYDIITTPEKEDQAIKPTLKSSLSHVRQVEFGINFSLNSE